MENMDTLIMGGAIELKEMTALVTNLEQYTKETEEASQETPATVLGRWLRMDEAEVKGLEQHSEPEEGKRGHKRHKGKKAESVEEEELEESEEPEKSDGTDLDFLLS